MSLITYFTLYYALLGCPEVKLVNKSGYAWNKEDYKVLELVKVRCGQIYKTSPCVKEFRKTGKQDYSVICGK